MSNLISRDDAATGDNIEIDLKSSYFYGINYTVFEKDLCSLEMKSMFNIIPKKKYLFSKSYINPLRSCFIKQFMHVMYTSDTLDNLVKQIRENNMSYEKFKVRFIDNDDSNINFEERKKAESTIGFYINGRPDLHNPQILIGITKIKDKWILGELTENKTTWKKHNGKPYSYSNALGVRIARALVNIATLNDSHSKLVDPCCGIGTVLMEALNMGIDIKGYELNPCIGENAKKNLEFFGYKDVVTIGSMHNIYEKFDCAIVDMPYGLFAPTTLEEQLEIIKTTSRISDRAIFITYKDMDNYLKKYGFVIKDKCSLLKGSINRYITVCCRVH